MPAQPTDYNPHIKCTLVCVCVLVHVRVCTSMLVWFNAIELVCKCFWAHMYCTCVYLSESARAWERAGDWDGVSRWLITSRNPDELQSVTISWGSISVISNYSDGPCVCQWPGFLCCRWEQCILGQATPPKDRAQPTLSLTRPDTCCHLPPKGSFWQLKNQISSALLLNPCVTLSIPISKWSWLTHVKNR